MDDFGFGAFFKAIKLAFIILLLIIIGLVLYIIFGK